MSQNIDIASIKISDPANLARTSLFNKVQWNQDSYISLNFPKQPNQSVLSNNVSMGIENFVAKTFNITDYNFEGNFNNITLEQLRVNNGAPEYKGGYWTAIVNEENGRICLKNVKVHQTGEHGHGHSHPVFEKIEFRDIIITLDIDGQEIKLHLDQNSPTFSQLFPASLFRKVGFNGSLNNNDGYQMGVKQTIAYVFVCANSLITLAIDFSFVFMYPANDFEPTGAIDANKIFPQIEFYSTKLNLNEYSTWNLDGLLTIVPESGRDGNKIRIKKYNARVKLICNNNSQEHITVYDGADESYFPELRRTGNLPAMFERNFNLDPQNYQLTRNIAGFYTDSNFGSTTKYGSYDLLRDKPSFPYQVIPKTIEDVSPAANLAMSVQLKRSQPAALWSNIFDYAHYNVSKETEFIAVHGIQGDRFDNENYTFPITLQPYIYPRDQFTKQVLIKKERRQAAFDNIHLHGYMGHYLDNDQPVIHAPICGYCCFHMHWRWSDLNVELAKNKLLRFANSYFKYFFDDGSKYKGWYTNTNDILMQQPFKAPGMPLIPYEQQLKIAITDPDVQPHDQENNVTPTNNPTLDHSRKAIWYCVDIENVDYGNVNRHLVMEQGCGFAYDYSDDGKNTPYAPAGLAFLPKLLREISSDYFNIQDQVFLDYVYDPNALVLNTKLRPNEMYELQYRIMRLFNEPNLNVPSGRKFLNQIPAINGDPYLYGVVDENTEQNLQYIFDQIINQ